MTKWWSWEKSLTRFRTRLEGEQRGWDQVSRYGHVAEPDGKLTKGWSLRIVLVRFVRFDDDNSAAATVTVTKTMGGVRGWLWWSQMVRGTGGVRGRSPVTQRREKAVPSLWTKEPKEGVKKGKSRRRERRWFLMIHFWWGSV